MSNQSRITYHAALQKLQRWGRPRKDFMKDRQHPQIYIDRMKFFLGLLGDPQDAYKVIHITGTAGKGTVSTMLQEALIASGRRTGLYTSPYCVSVIENIRVNHLYISPAFVTLIVELLKRMVERARRSSYGVPSYFELMTAVAFLYFKKQKCDWVVLEAGLGGRYDATNVVDRPVVTAITSVGYDHTDVLGKTLQKIARDKAGIIKPLSSFFTAVSDPTILTLFQKICKEQSATFTSVKGSNEELVHRIGVFLKLSKSAIKKGIAKIRLPCHLELIDKRPTIILDGAHNELKINYFFDHLKHIPIDKRIIIFGIADNKDKKNILRRIAQETDTIVFTPFTLTGFPGRHCADPLELSKIIKQYRKDLTITIASSPSVALKQAQALSNQDGTIIITGSFYLCGELRRRWYSEEWVLTHRTSFR